jgi:transcriptional regulator with XRE-family HTH domain
LTPKQSKAARGLIGWSQSELADAAKVGRSSVADFEAGRDVSQEIRGKMRAALTRAGIEFINKSGVKLTG